MTGGWVWKREKAVGFISQEDFTYHGQELQPWMRRQRKYHSQP